MVVELTVENLAIIERAQISLGPGFTVLTGETGAGKSLLVDAIELALGERADSDLVRTGATRASVNVVFDLSAQPELRSKCIDLGLNLEDGALFIQREVFAEGRSQCRVGGRLAPVSGLKQLGQLLVDLHGQHDHQSLLHPERHIIFLDSWIGEPAKILLAEVAEKFSAVQDLQTKLSSLRSGLRDREQRLDMLKFQIGEIEAVDPQPGEMPELEALLSRLKNSEKLGQAAAFALNAINEKEGCVADSLGAALRNLEDAAKLDPLLDSVIDPLRSSLYSLEEGSRLLSSYADTVESNPDQLEETAARIDGLKRLRRKYGEDETSILEFLENARRELGLLADSESNESDLQAALDSAKHELEQVCEKLTALRKEKAVEFSKLVETQLRDLAMERALFEVSITRKAIELNGADNVEYFFSANLGEAQRPLAKIASGGEISRVMLAIKTALAGRAGVPTLVFDEVDAGLSGRAAAAVAKKLEQLAEHYQILVISHLPQIASRATSHFRIEKNEEGNRVTTGVRLLSHEERVEEIARMLAGEQVSERAMENARELLSHR